MRIATRCFTQIRDIQVAVYDKYREDNTIIIITVKLKLFNGYTSIYLVTVCACVRVLVCVCVCVCARARVCVFVCDY